MIKTTYQTPELRNANDEVVQEGAFGKNTALSNSTNDGWIDYVMNDLEALHDTIGDSAPTLDGNGHVVEPANLAIGDEDGVRLKTGYLKTSGGTVSGTLNVAQNLKMQDNQENVFGGMYVPASSATSQFLQIYGGETPSNNGGNLQLPSDGSWILQAKNGTTAYNLVGGTDGTLKWRGNNVAVLASPAFTGNPTAPTQATNDDSTKLATTAYVKYNLRTHTPLISDISVTSLNANDDLDSVTTTGTYKWTSEAGIPSNAPSTARWAKMFVVTTINSSWIVQLVIGNGGTSYVRRGRYYQSAWSFESWRTTAYAENVLPLAGGTMTGSLRNTVDNDTAYIAQLNNLEKGVATTGATNRYFLLAQDVNSANLNAISVCVYPSGSKEMRLISEWTHGQLFLSFGHNTNDNKGNFSPYPSNSCSLGIAGRLWEQLYAGTTTISTSDERLKNNITDIPDAVLDAWGEVNWYQYQFKDSIAEKGATKARLHTGAIAQRIESIFESHGLDANKYGLLCYDEWKSEPAERDEDGNIVQPARPAGNRYSLRYEEALCMEAAYQRRRADRLEQRLEAIEQRLSALETL